MDTGGKLNAPKGADLMKSTVLRKKGEEYYGRV